MKTLFAMFLVAAAACGGSSSANLAIRECSVTMDAGSGPGDLQAMVADVLNGAFDPCTNQKAVDTAWSSASLQGIDRDAATGQFELHFRLRDYGHIYEP